jgi:hypothetical protein
MLARPSFIATEPPQSLRTAAWTRSHFDREAPPPVACATTEEPSLEA